MTKLTKCDCNCEWSVEFQNENECAYKVNCAKLKQKYGPCGIISDDFIYYKDLKNFP